MAQVLMPTGDVVEMPDNPTPDQLAQLALIHSPSGVTAPPITPTAPYSLPQTGPAPAPPSSVMDTLANLFSNAKQNLDITSPAAKAAGREGAKSGIRGVATGLTGMAGLMADANQGAANIMTQTPHQMPSATLQQYLTSQLGPDQHPGQTLATSLLFGASDPTMLAMRALQPAAAAATQGYATPAQVANQTLIKGMDLGYKVTPSQSPAAGIGSSVLENTGGSVALKQLAQYKNYNTTQRVAAQIAGLRPDEAITPASMEAVIAKTYANSHDPINNIPLITMGPQYTNDLRNIAAATPTTGVGTFNPSEIATAYHQPFMGGAEAIDNVKQLRQLAHDAYTSNAVDKTLRGNTYSNVANAIENGVARNISGDTLSDFQAGRTQLAQQFAIRRAMIPGAGGIDPTDIGTQMASQFSKQGKSPFTGNLQTIGEMANTYPKMMRVPGSEPAALTKTDQGLLAAAAYAAKESAFGKMAALAGLAGVRPGIRAALMSNPYQQAFIKPNINPGVLSQLLGNQGIQNAAPAAYQGLFGPQQ